MISIITPTYNRAPLLHRMIKSVQQQNFKQWELLIIDDGSTDETREVVGSIKDSRIRYVYTSHTGAAKKRNLGLDLAQNENIIFLDSDDEVTKNWLELMWNGVRDQKAEIVCCAHKRYNALGKLTDTIVPENIGNMFNGYNIVMSYISGTFLIEKKIIQAVGGYDPNLASGQHTDLLIRLLPSLSNKTIVNIYEPLVLVHEHGGPRIRKDYEALYQGGIGMIKKHNPIFTENKEILYNYFSIAGVNAIRTGRVKEAKKLMFKAFLVYPYKRKSIGRLIASYVPYLNKKIW